MQRDVAQYERSEINTPLRKNVTSGIPLYPPHHFMNVERGHEMGVRHVGGLGHVAPI
jgi:hypothetical protein